MKLSIPKEQSERIVVAMKGISEAMPDKRAELADVFRQAKRGITIEIRPMEAYQTDEQRGYYWLWMKNFAAFCGNTPDEMHEHILCEAFGSEYQRTRLGIMKRPKQRSSGSNRPDYSHLIETLVRVAAEMGFIVPPAQVRMDHDDRDD